MPNQETITGIVLSAAPMGEYDKRLVLLTKEYGKIAAFARGARKPNSALLAICQPFSFGKYHILIGRNSYTILGAEISNYFSELREDLKGVSYGFYFCEFVSYMSKEGLESGEMLKLLYASLRALTRKKISFSLIRFVFELKMMFLNGEGPQVFACVLHKGAEVNLECEYFSSEAGGILCPDCRRNKRGFSIEAATLYTLQYIASSSMERLYSFTVSDSVLEELRRITKDYLSWHLNIAFKSLEMLEWIQDPEGKKS